MREPLCEVATKIGTCQDGFRRLPLATDAAAASAAADDADADVFKVVAVGVSMELM